MRSTAAHVPQYRYRASLRYTFQGRLSAGFSKVCEIFKVCVIESLKYIREFHTTVCYCGDISMPRNVMLNKTNCDWLFDMSVKRPHGWALTNECSHIFQTVSLKVLAMRDYMSSNDYSTRKIFVDNFLLLTNCCSPTVQCQVVEQIVFALPSF